MGKRRAIVYVTDAGFLMPSLFSASQLADKTTACDVADVFVILVGVDPPDALGSAFADLGIRFLSLDQETFWRKDVFFNRTHVPVASLGRLAMQDVLPESYEHVLYLDGDTYIADDIRPLVEHTVAPGKIAAANDCSWLSKGQLGSFWRRHVSYCRSLGLSDPSSYFNAGVLAFRTSTWREMAPRALEFFEAKSELCNYHDQSALNAVFKDCREVLSPMWNYQSSYAELGGRDVRPHILHFTGGFKPWRTRNSVWGAAIFDEYTQFMKRYPILDEIKPLGPRDDVIRLPSYLDRFGPRNVVETVRKVRKRVLFSRYLTRTQFAF